MVNKKFFSSIQKQVTQYNAHLIAVTKSVGVEEIKTLYHLGQRDFGENRVPDLLEKEQLLSFEMFPDLRWHFIGNLQRNKVKSLLSCSYRLSSIHSVDRLELLQELIKHSSDLHHSLDILIQLKFSDEEEKSGFDPDLKEGSELKQALQLLQSLPKSEKLTWKGWMCMAPIRISENNQLIINNYRNQFKADDDSLSDQLILADHVFSLLNNFDKQQLSKFFPQLASPRILSMGMSQDYEIALKNGSTHIRVGSLLFN